MERGRLGASPEISGQRRYSPSPLGLTFLGQEILRWAGRTYLEQVPHPGSLFVSTDLGPLSLTRTPSQAGGTRKRPTATTSRQPEKPLSNVLTHPIPLKDTSQPSPAERHQTLSLGKPFVLPQVTTARMSGRCGATWLMYQAEMTQEL